MVERQFNEVLSIVEQAQLMKGMNGKRLLIRMYDSRRAVGHARQVLKNAGTAEDAIELRTWDQTMDLPAVFFEFALDNLLFVPKAGHTPAASTRA